MTAPYLWHLEGVWAGLATIPRMIRAAGRNILSPNCGVLAVRADAFAGPGAIEGLCAAETAALFAMGQSRIRSFVGEHSSL
jgi:hypothetical protein